MGGFEVTLVTFGVSVVAGLVGSLLGLGGGMIVVPALTLGFGLDIRHAFGASLVAVIATSSGAAVAYVRERKTNLRIAMFLEVGTTLGAVTGAVVAGMLDARILHVFFGLLLMGSAFSMLRLGREARAPKPDRVADRLRLHGSYHDESTGQEMVYRVSNSVLSLLFMFVAGVLSGLLGIGSGILKVPVMDIAMGLPIKVSNATSNFMIGVTAAASAGVYFFRGDVLPFVAGPVAVGVLSGATIGARLMGRIPDKRLRLAFVLILAVVSIQMVVKGVRS